MGIRRWSARAFQVESDRPVPAGIDGEATVLDPPLRFVIRPGALRVRIAADHAGASPSAVQPDSPVAAVATLAKFAFRRAAPSSPR